MGDRRYWAALGRLLDRNIATPDGSLFLAAHEGAHALDLGLPDCRTATIGDALVALPPDRRLRAEAVAVAVSLLVVAWAGNLDPYWTRERIVARVAQDSRYGSTRPTHRQPHWSVEEIDAALTVALAAPRTRSIAYQVACGDVPWPEGARKGSEVARG